MTLIITGCIDVSKNMPFVAVTDLETRLNAYVETIRWAIEETKFKKIIFCENSNYNFNEKECIKLAKKYEKSFEYLTFSGDTKKCEEKGKGYGEGEIINHVLENSKLLKDEDYFYKITGRLKIKNINKLIKSNKKNYFMNKKLLNEVDTRFYGINKETFIKNLKNEHEKVNDFNNYYLEHAYHDALIKRNVKYRTFCERPLFIGIAGSTGKIYADEKSKFELYTKLLFVTNIYNKKNYWKLRKFVKKIVTFK